MIEKELAEIREKSNALKANWKQEKDLIAKARALKEKIEQLKLEEQTEERKGNLQRVARNPLRPAAADRRRTEEDHRADRRQRCEPCAC